MTATLGLLQPSMTSITSGRLGACGGLPNSLMSAPAIKVLPSQTHDAYGTHSPYERVVGAVRAAGADGFNGDQMYGVPAGFQEAATADGGAPIVLEPESELAAKQSAESLLLLIAAVPAVCFNNSATGVATDAMTWSGAYAFDSQPAPLTLSFKALEHRHMVHVLQRDRRDRNRAVQTSWFARISREQRCSVSAS